MHPLDHGHLDARIRGHPTLRDPTTIDGLIFIHSSPNPKSPHFPPQPRQTPCLIINPHTTHLANKRRSQHDDPTDAPLIDLPNPRRSHLHPTQYGSCNCLDKSANCECRPAEHTRTALDPDDDDQFQAVRIEERTCVLVPGSSRGGRHVEEGVESDGCMDGWLCVSLCVSSRLHRFIIFLMCNYRLLPPFDITHPTHNPALRNNLDPPLSALLEFSISPNNSTPRLRKLNSMASKHPRYPKSNGRPLRPR